MSKEEFLKAAQETPFFPNTSKSYLDKTINDLTNNLGYTQEECIEIYKKNPEAMLYSSQFIIGNANNTMKLLNIENTEEFREMTSTNPFLINFKELETSIKNIREFLDTDDETVKKMIKAQPFLGTMKLEHLKSNFYNFKNHINVTRERMSEIAIMSPITLTVPFDLNKKKYENISKTLNILPETFYKKANVLPAMYRINTKKIEKYIDYVSKLFNYSRQEAINYIAQNLNILSYKFSNIVNRSEKNYEILNNTLNINFNSYLDMVEENAWILGHQPDFIKKTIKDVKKYFNVDKETLAIMLKKNPQMVTSFINNIDKNADKVSGYFNINKETFKKLCIIEPKLATRFITLHQSDIPYNATVLEMSEKDFIKLGLENPTLLIENYETIYDIKERVDFSGTINQEEMNLANPAINDEKSFFEETLACAIASALGLSIKNKKISIPEMFSQCKKAFVELKVPKHILSERFGEFAKEFIKNNNLENRCKILVKKI